MLTKNKADYSLVNGSRGVVVDFKSAKGRLETLLGEQEKLQESTYDEHKHKQWRFLQKQIEASQNCIDQDDDIRERCTPRYSDNEVSGKTSPGTSLETSTGTSTVEILYPIVNFIRTNSRVVDDRSETPKATEAAQGVIQDEVNQGVMIFPENFENDIYMIGHADRIQVPLRLAWAVTIHKAQGATLDYLHCDLQGAFE